MGKVLAWSGGWVSGCRTSASQSVVPRPTASASPGNLLKMQNLRPLPLTHWIRNSGMGSTILFFTSSLGDLRTTTLATWRSHTWEMPCGGGGIFACTWLWSMSFEADPKCSGGYWGHVTIKWSLRGSHCAEDTQAANSLTRSNFLQIKKC